jgi:hypothetical protein
VIRTIREFARRHATILIGLFSVAFFSYQIGRLLRAERLITGGELSLPLDDSFIYLQYARAIAEGHPFVYTPGNAPTNGTTVSGSVSMLTSASSSTSTIASVTISIDVLHSNGPAHRMLLKRVSRGLLL